MKKILSIIFGIIAVAFIGLGFFLMQDSGRAKNCVRVDGGRIDSINEGKAVIVTGTLKIEKPIYDKLTRLTFPRALRAGRTTQVYSRKYDNEKKVYRYSWDNASGKSNAYMIAEASVGDFKLSPKLVEKIAVSINFKEYNPQELAKAGLVMANFNDNSSRIFVTKAPKAQEGTQELDSDRKLIKKILFGSGKNKYVGMKRYSYTVSEVTGGEAVTVLAKQKGNVLELHEDFAIDPIRKGALNDKELQKSLKRYNFYMMLGCIIPAIVCAGIAWFFWQKK